MDVGVAKETRDLDLRVSLCTHSVAELVRAGHRVYVETRAGAGAGFSDEAYVKAGATVVYSTEEIYKRAEVLCKVSTPSLAEIDEMMPGQTVCTFGHLAAASKERFDRLRERQVTVVAYERLRDGACFPILRAMSELAGRLVPQIAAWKLQSPEGRGLLLSGIPGLPPAEVCILGAGEVGFNAARAFAGIGAQVTVLDQPGRLSDIDRIFDVPGRIRLVYASPEEIAKAVAYADVFVGAILVPGERAPHAVSEEMVAAMRPGSVIIDVSIDQGGCVDTSRPTTLRDPTYVKHGVTHYCVPNFTALVARTASRALSNVLRPYLLRGLERPHELGRDGPLGSAVVLSRGKVIDARLAAAQGVAIEQNGARSAARPPDGADSAKSPDSADSANRPDAGSTR